MDRLEEFQDQISQLRCPNVEYRYFIPHHVLMQLMSKDWIYEVLVVSGLERQYIQEIANVIATGAHKIFAILILIGKAKLVTNFIERDQLQPSMLDHKLPFRQDDLEQFLPITAAQKFHERQWEFTAPVFSGRLLPRCLENQVVLPFVGDKVISEGGFGVVHEIKIHPSHWDLPGEFQQEVRNALLLIAH
jgi:hypothetical protein